MNRRNVTGLLAAAPFGLGLRTAQGRERVTIAPPPLDFLKSLSGWMEDGQTPGFAAGVVRNGALVWQHQAGLADVEKARPVVANSLFPAASLGKLPFACSVCRLAAAGQFDLARPINTYLDADKPTGRWADDITARHLLSHSSGLPNWRTDGEALTPAFQPGTQFRYSGEGYYLLQRAVEAVTGQGCEAWMQAGLIRDLGMASSTYLWRADATERLVQGYRSGKLQTFSNFAPILYDEITQSSEPLASWTSAKINHVMQKKAGDLFKIANPQPPKPEDMVPNVASSLLTTVGDYARFLASFCSPGTLGLGAQHAEMIRPTVTINTALAWGLGWGIETQGGQRYLWQWGDNGAWKNFTMVHPESRSAFVVFTNGSNGMHIAERFARAVTRQDNAAFLWL